MAKIDRTQVQNGEIIEDLIASGAVTAAKIGADAIDGSKVADAAIDSEHLASGAIDDGHLSSGAKTAVLASKRFAPLLASADFTNPTAATVSATAGTPNTEFGFGTNAGVIGDGSVSGVPVLLELTAGNAGQPNGFNTNSSKVWAGEAGKYAAQVFALDGSEITDEDGQKVWGIITASARTTGGDYTLRFYSDEWPSRGSEIVLSRPYTMGQDYFLAYPKFAGIDALPVDAFRSDTIKLSKVAAGILGNSIGTAELEDLAVTEAKLADGAVATAKIADSAVTEAKILDSSVTSSKINNGAVTEGKIADGAVVSAKIGADAVDGSKIADDSIDSEHIADGAIDTAHIGDAQVTAAKVASELLLRNVELGLAFPAEGAVVFSAGTECAVEALAVPGMAVRVQVGGTVYNSLAGRIAMGTTASLSIDAAPSIAGQQRWDSIVVNAAGSYAVRKGTALGGGAAEPPSLTSGDVLLAQVFIDTDVTSLGDEVIYDHRRKAAPAKQTSSAAGDGSTASFTLPGRVRGAVAAFRNGLRLRKSDSPATMDQYSVTNPPGADGTVITFGADVTDGADLDFDFIA